MTFPSMRLRTPPPSTRLGRRAGAGGRVRGGRQRARQGCRLATDASFALGTCRGRGSASRGGVDIGSISIVIRACEGICLSLISTHSAVRARYIVRQISRRAPCARLLVGFWRSDPGELAATVATIARPDAIVVTSLRDAVMDLQSVLSPDGGSASAVPAIRATDVGQAAMPSGA